MTRRKKRKTIPKRKMSEMISEVAADFLGVGDTIDEQQNRLNAVCSAWNLACASPDVRQRQLERHIDIYIEYNPHTTSSELADIIKDLQLLIERKLELFPDDHRQIVGAKVLKSGSEFRIEVVSATLQ